MPNLAYSIFKDKADCIAFFEVIKSHKDLGEILPSTFSPFLFQTARILLSLPIANRSGFRHGYSAPRAPLAQYYAFLKQIQTRPEKQAPSSLLWRSISGPLARGCDS